MTLEAKRAAFIHIGEEALEDYAFGRLPAAELASIEEHLLCCEHCRTRLEAEDDFAEAIRVLARTDQSQLQPGLGGSVDQSRAIHPALAPASPSASWLRPYRLWTWFPPSMRGWDASAWGAALAVIAVTGVIAWRLPREPDPMHDTSAHDASGRDSETVTLTTLRGGGRDDIAQAKADRPLDLSINVVTAAPPETPGSLREAGPYRLEVVDAAGDLSWAGAVSPSASGTITARVDKRLGAGTYWVRLYASSGKLLREFGLYLA